MVAEIFLYSKLYHLLQRVDRRAMGTEEGGELQLWREEWDYLFRNPPALPNINGDADFLGEEGHQYIEIGYFFAHLMLHAQALKLLDDGKGTPIEGSPAPVRTPGGEMSTHDQKKSHMSAISQLSTQILQRARRVEVVEMRVISHDYLELIIARY